MKSMLPFFLKGEGEFEYIRKKFHDLGNSFKIKKISHATIAEPRELST